MEDNEFSDPDFLASLAEFIGSRTGPITLMLLAEILKDLAEEKLSGLSHDQQFLKRIVIRWWPKLSHRRRGVNPKTVLSSLVLA